MLRRKRMPDTLVPAWEAFQSQVEHVEQARQALLGCLPVGRVEPAPVTVGLDLLRDELLSVRARIDEWRVEPVLPAWQACVTSVDTALAAVEPARDVAESTAELQEVIEAVAEIVEVLEVWRDAERRWLSLRVRG